MKRVFAEEQMDDPALPPETYRAVLEDLAAVNRLTLAHRPTLRFLAQAMRGRKRLKLLDVGFGQGDMLRHIARWAARQGIPAELVGIDLNPGSAAIAEAATDPALPIRYLTGDYASLGGEGFDCIVSSLLAHHMSTDELLAFLRFMETEARCGWFVNDIRRSRLAHIGFPILAQVMRWHRIVREDGTLSIARSFVPADWHQMLAQAGIAPQAARIHAAFPFRLCVTRIY